MLTGRFLGVDGGQSGTTAVIGDESGNVLGWATGGPCNHVAAPEARAKFLRVIGECLTEAATRAGMTKIAGDRWHFKCACLGMSGGIADKYDLLRELIEADHLLITDDANIALAGATGGEPGIVVIGGTGSIAFAKNARGETARAGGWGYIFGDEGGAFDIVRQALRGVLREHEGWGGHTALTPALIEATGAAGPNEMLHFFYRPEWPRARVAGLARIVSRLAEEGDPLAIQILQNSARELAMLAASVRRQLWTDEEPVTVSWVGGVFENALLLERFRSLLSINGNVTTKEPVHGPARGALILACRSAPALPVLPEPHG